MKKSLLILFTALLTFAVNLKAETTSFNAVQELTYTVILEDAGTQKLEVIKVVKEVLGMSLKEAKDLVLSAPCTLVEGTTKEIAELLVSRLEDLGATVRVEVNATIDPTEDFIFVAKNDMTLSGDNLEDYVDFAKSFYGLLRTGKVFMIDSGVEGTANITNESGKVLFQLTLQLNPTAYYIKVPADVTRADEIVYYPTEEDYEMLIAAQGDLEGGDMIDYAKARSIQLRFEKPIVDMVIDIKTGLDLNYLTVPQYFGMSMVMELSGLQKVDTTEEGGNRIDTYANQAGKKLFMLNNNNGIIELCPGVTAADNLKLTMTDELRSMIHQHIENGNEDGIYHGLDPTLFDNCKSITINFGGTTGITAPETSQEQHRSSDFFTIDGRQLPAAPTQKGIYIHQGKKFYYKGN